MQSAVQKSHVGIDTVTAKTVEKEDPERQPLFRHVRTAIGIYGHEEKSLWSQELRSVYEDPGFTKVT